MSDTGLVIGEDGKQRCWWHGGHKAYIAYHDTEWGRPQANDHVLFEKLCLEGFQAGLSWWTVLRKRPEFRKEFANFDFEKVARYTEKDIIRMLGNAGIIRHRGKIESAINNAQKACDLVDEMGSIAAFLWSHEPDPSTRPKVFDKKTLWSLTQTPESQAISKGLKKRGWRFVGPTTMYAMMQAMGMVNDHLEGCWCRDEVEKDRAAFVRPT